MGMINFSNETIKISVVKQDTNKSDVPIALQLEPYLKDMPVLKFRLECDINLYKEQCTLLLEYITSWIKSEEALHKKMNFAATSQFLYLFKNSNIVGLPGNLATIEEALAQKPFNCYSRFLNLLSQISIIFDPHFIEAIKGRFIYFLLSVKDRNDCVWTLEDLYKLAYYYDWAYLIPMYQTTNPPVIDNKLDI